MLISQTGKKSRLLSLDSFKIIRNYVNQRFGIHFSDSDRYLLENRLEARLTDLDLRGFDEYVTYLGQTEHHAELDIAIELLTNNETYFFREDYQLNAFLNELLPVLREKKAQHRQLTIWSAGCSSGEEVYSIAIFIAESGLFPGWDIRVLGSDINSRVLTKARSGKYSKSAFRNTPGVLKSKYFRQIESEWELDKRIREKCSFARINLLDTDGAGLPGKFDAIFCRNVLMYFDSQSRATTVDLFHSRLHRSGYLLLGHTESLFSQDTPFAQVQLRDAMVYQKQEDRDA